MPAPPQSSPLDSARSADQIAWSGSARVRWRRDGEAFELWLNEVTSQTRVYKQTLDQFFRRDFREWRPPWGDFAVEIGRNLIHASDSPENGEKEVALFFQEHELVQFERSADPWIYE